MLSSFLPDQGSLEYKRWCCFISFPSLLIPLLAPPPLLSSSPRPSNPLFFPPSLFFLFIRHKWMSNVFSDDLNYVWVPRSASGFINTVRHLAQHLESVPDKQHKKRAKYDYSAWLDKWNLAHGALSLFCLTALGWLNPFLGEEMIRNIASLCITCLKIIWTFEELPPYPQWRGNIFGWVLDLLIY